MMMIAARAGSGIGARICSIQMETGRYVPMVVSTAVADLFDHANDLFVEANGEDARAATFVWSLHN